MKKALLKKIVTISIFIMLFSILFSKICFSADNTSNVNAENNVDRYTIEDIIFDRVPIFNINFFSNKKVESSITQQSAIYKIRSIISVWYVSFRNLAIIALSIILIYVGIRMALSTIPEKKATYKHMLVSWIKALVALFVIHLIMILVINLNQEIVEIIEKSEINIMQSYGMEEDSIYDTIRTRAFSISFSSGITGMIMYLFLVIIWAKFIWVYIKRTMTVMLLIIIAPFISVKYAIDSATGKKSSMLADWLYDFSMNVFLQSVHAIIYTTLVSSAIVLSMQSIMGFIIALIVLNFMVKADELFRSIFSFDRAKSLGDTAKQESFSDVLNDLGGALFVGQMFRMSKNFAWGIGKGTKNTVKSAYRDAMRENPSLEQGINSGLDSVDSFIERAFHNTNTDIGLIDDFGKYMYNSAKIRRLSRIKGSLGVKSRTIKKQMHSNVKKRFSSNYKLIKTSLLGAGSVILAVPLTVASPKVGAGLFTSGMKKIGSIAEERNYEHTKNGKRTIANSIGNKFGIYRKYYAINQGRNKYIKKRNKIYDTIKGIEELDSKETEIKNKYAETINATNATEKQKTQFKTDMSKILVEANMTEISRVIDEYVRENNITTIDNSSINEVIDVVVDSIGQNIELDNLARNQVASRAKSSIIQQSYNDRRTQDDNSTQQENRFTIDNISKTISEHIIEQKVDDNFSSVAKDILDLDTKVRKVEKKAKMEIRNVNRFVENL